MRKAIQFSLVAVLVAAFVLFKIREDKKPGFSDLGVIDVHAHILVAPVSFLETLKRLRMIVINICYINQDDRGFENLEPQQSTAIRISQQSNGTIRWCGTFDPSDWESPDFVNRASDQVQFAIQNGAVAIKIHKSIGMLLQSQTGSYLLPDNPQLAQVFSSIEKTNKTLFAHVADPTEAWQPLRRGSLHHHYYKTHPAFHMYLHSERPGKNMILDARDRVLKEHRELRMIGCHLGSMEDDLTQLGRRLDQYPNFAVDTATALGYLMLQPGEEIKAFLMKYQDRVMYGTDLGLVPWKDPAETVRHYEEQLARDFAYLSSDQVVTFRGRKIKGIDLPASVLRKIYHDNALKWIPDIRK